MSSWNVHVWWPKKAVLERERVPDLVCKVVEKITASEKGGTEEVDSAIEGQSLLASGLSKQMEKGDQKVASAINA